jgi:hypothetical protein
MRGCSNLKVWQIIFSFGTEFGWSYRGEALSSANRAIGTTTDCLGVCTAVGSTQYAVRRKIVPLPTAFCLLPT